MLDAMGAILAASAPASASILLASMGGLINQRAGIVNIGLEGLMLIGAFAAVMASAQWRSAGVGVLAALVAAALAGLIFSWTMTRLGANQIIAGLGLNLFVAGLFGYLLPVHFGVSGTLQPRGLTGLPSITIPLIGALPGIGPIISGHDPLTYVSWISVPVVAWFLYRTTWGMVLRATGADEEAARAAGIHTRRVQDISTLIAGAFSGLAGAQLSLGVVQLFNKQMTGGRGFIALAAFYFGDARPDLTAVAAVLFGVFESASFRLQSENWPPQIVQMLPYVVVVLSVTAVSYRRLHRARRRARRLARQIKDAA